MYSLFFYNVKKILVFTLKFIYKNKIIAGLK